MSKFKPIKEFFTKEQIREIENKIPYFSNFLNRYSQPQGIRLKILDFALYLNKYFNKDILDAKTSEIELFFENYVSILPGRKTQFITKKTAKKWRIFIRKYFDIVNYYLENDGQIKIKNPVPPKEIYDFKGLDHTIDILKETSILTYNKIKKILKQLYLNYIGASEKHLFKEYQIFIAVSLQAYSGARIREVLRINLDKLDLENRWFITTVKSPKTHKREGLYFFPQFFISELKYYISKLKEKYPGEIKYLFQYSKENPYLPERIIQKRIQIIKERNNIEYGSLTHAFRDFLNTKRLELGLSDNNLRKFLLNQKPGDVNPENYLKKFKQRIALRDLYDKYSPYKELLKPDLKNIL